MKCGLTHSYGPEDEQHGNGHEYSGRTASLVKGRRVEMEHTDDPAEAEKIAKDHLKEDLAYYDKLEVIEKK